MIILCLHTCSQKLQKVLQMGGKTILEENLEIQEWRKKKLAFIISEKFAIILCFFLGNMSFFLSPRYLVCASLVMGSLPFWDSHNFQERPMSLGLVHGAFSMALSLLRYRLLILGFWQFSAPFSGAEDLFFFSPPLDSMAEVTVFAIPPHWLKTFVI